LARCVRANGSVVRGRPPPLFLWRTHMSWTKPEFEVVELGMEVGAYAGNA
jgi:coenzyme PQQ precursor peptide PqqA